MKHLRFLFIKHYFNLLNVCSNISALAFLNKHKIKIGMIVLALRATDSKAQVELSRGRCYIGIPPTHRRIGSDIQLSNRFPNSKTDGNTFQLKVGTDFKMLQLGVASGYQFHDKSVDLGPYMRLYPLRRRSTLYFVEGDYQFNLQNNKNNELNIGIGIHKLFNYIGLEIACTYTYSSTYDDMHNFRLQAGIHYQIVPGKLKMKMEKAIRERKAKKNEE